ncbi:MAG: 5'/3'-nucleotidase SurE [Psychroflexus sp.]|nr:5'/3'-nucleotidase SurE [Psychroflexus sp.]MDN6310609.1 5'/3'-nucleotidase SurE [Psychroflexus sp.]
MSRRPLILVTNDDGITAPGIRHLIQIMNTIGDVVVVAPDRPQSGMGHAITLNENLYCDPVVVDQYSEIEEFSCSGTPVDCVKIGTQQILERQPDLLVSGINHGSNASINVMYSGTMSAAVEAGIEGIPAIGFSLLDYSMEADFKPCTKFVKRIALEVLEKGLPPHTVLNVNIPIAEKSSDIKGIKVCRQAKARWQEVFDKRSNPQGRDYYWLSGEFVNQDEGKDTDIEALENNYVSVVPIQFDLTAHTALETIEKWNFNG